MSNELPDLEMPEREKTERERLYSEPVKHGPLLEMILSLIKEMRGEAAEAFWRAWYIEQPDKIWRGDE